MDVVSGLFCCDDYLRSSAQCLREVSSQKLNQGSNLTLVNDMGKDYTTFCSGVSAVPNAKVKENEHHNNKIWICG